MASELAANGIITNGKESKKRKHRAEQDEIVDGEIKKPSKEERREAKRLKKLAKEEALPRVKSGEAEVVEDVNSLDAEAAKRKRKEEKKKRKREEKALQSQKVVESEAVGALTANGDANKAESDERGAMNGDRMQMIEKAEARDHGTVEGKKLARTEKNARNKQKKKAKKAERIQAAGPVNDAEPDSKVADVTPGSKEKEPSHQKDSVSIQAGEKSGEGQVSRNTFKLDAGLQAHICRMQTWKILTVSGKSGRNVRRRKGELHGMLHEELHQRQRQ